MKNIYFSFIALLILSTTVLYGQNTGDFRSAQSGTWGTLTTWQTWNGSSWVAASTNPDSTSSAVVTVVSPHNVTVAATIGVRNVTINSGATLTVNGEPIVLYITQEGMTVNGTLILTGNVATAAPYSIVSTTGSLIIGSTGVVNYRQGAVVVSTKGALPTATWQTGSTLNIDSTGGTAATGWGAGTAQNFYNVNWNCTKQTASFGWGFTNHTVGGTFAILATNTGRVQLFGGSSGTLNIMGDFIVSGAANATNNGTSSGTNDTINIYGKININTTGNFSISRGSQGTVGTSIWNFYGDSVKIIAGTMQNSNTTPDGAKFIFKKNGTQYLTITPTVLTGNALPVEIGVGSTVSLLSPVNITTLYLNGGMIESSAANPLIMGWWTSTTLTNGNVSPTAPGSETSYIKGPMAFLYATAAGSFNKTYPIGKGTYYRPVTLALTQTAATVSRYTAEFINSIPPTNGLPLTLDKVSTFGHFVVSEETGGSPFTAGSVLLNYGTGDGVSDAANLRIAKGPAVGGGTWVDLGGTGNGVPNGTITSTNPFTDLTNTIFTLANHTGGSNSLPVELSSFTVSNQSGTVILNWATSTEKNYSKFVVERALLNTNSLTWSNAGTVHATGTSTSAKNYSFTETLQTGKYQFRLKIVDLDGSFNYSGIVEIEVLEPKCFNLSQNYPNPFNPSTRIEYSIPSDSKIILEVFSLTGERVSQLINQEQLGGYYSVDFNSSLYKNIPSGIYFYRLTSVEKISGNSSSVIKKMLLLK